MNNYLFDNLIFLNIPCILRLCVIRIIRYITLEVVIKTIDAQASIVFQSFYVVSIIFSDVQLVAIIFVLMEPHALFLSFSSVNRKFLEKIR